MKKSLFVLLAAFAFTLAALVGGSATRDDPAPKNQPPPEVSAEVETSEPSSAFESSKPTEDVTEAKATEPPKLATDYEIELIARTIWGEAEGVQSRAEQAAVAWCILNRVDNSGKTIESVITALHQFYYKAGDNLPSWTLELAEDVLWRWGREWAGETDVGRTLPVDYLYFVGDGWRNHFSIEWKSKEYWDWSLPDPYEN